MKRIGNLITEDNITVELCMQSIYEASKNKLKAIIAENSRYSCIGISYIPKMILI